MRDLVGASERVVERERQKLAREGWAARLLARQDSEGTWDGGLYSPKWTSTTYTMLLLRDFGLPGTNPQARKACALLLDRGLQRDRRLAEAIAIVRRKQQDDGRWLLENRHKGKTFFELEGPGTPSRWNTLRALRVLRWWDERE